MGVARSVSSLKSSASEFVSHVFEVGGVQCWVEPRRAGPLEEDSLTCARLAEAYGIAVSELVFTRTPKGKPFVTSGRKPNVDFNFSHSGPWQILAIHNEGRVGVDIENLRHIPHQADRILQRFFHPAISEQFDEINDDHSRSEFFFQLWTAHEATIKFYGESSFKPIWRECDVHPLHTNLSTFTLVSLNEFLPDGLVGTLTVQNQ